MKNIYGKICRAHGCLNPLTMWHFFGFESITENGQRIVCTKHIDEHDGPEHATIIERGERSVLVRWRDDSPGYICQLITGHQIGESNEPVLA